jgi:hypothetical protein
MIFSWGLHNLVEENYNYSNSLFHEEMNSSAFITNMASWEEQRWFNYMAIDALGDMPLAATIKSAIHQMMPKVTNQTVSSHVTYI